MRVIIKENLYSQALYEILEYEKNNIGEWFFEEAILQIDELGDFLDNFNFDMFQRNLVERIVTELQRLGVKPE